MSLFQGIRYFLLPKRNKKSALKAILGFFPSNLQLYEQAFRHKSIINEKAGQFQSNERLEYLGDAILSAVIADYFFNRFPYKDEGFLTKVRAKLVSRSFLNKLSVELGLDTFLETSANLKRSKSIYGDAFEALIGAIYLDKGYESCKKFLIERVISDYIDINDLIEKEIDYKSKLVEWSQKNNKHFDYQLIELSNGDRKYFKCCLLVEGKEVGKGEAYSKKKAQQQAAGEFFQEYLAKI